MLGWLAVVAGLVTLAVGVHEIRTGRPVVRWIGSQPDTIRRHGWLCIVLGGYIALFALSSALDLPVWVDVGLLMAVLAVAAWAAFARPFAPRHRPAVPPSDPDAVWKRSPPGT